MSNAVYDSPNALNYLIGKGIITIAPVNEVTGMPGTYVDLGNCPRFEFETNEQAVTHSSSRYKVKEEDAEYVIMTGYNLNFTLDEVSIENMKLFLRATNTIVTLVNTLHANQEIDTRYSVKFASDNSAGPDSVWTFHKVKLTPSGTFSLISDEYTSMSFAAKGLAERIGHPTSPFFDMTLTELA
jgi:hypothetical protein